MIGQRALDKQRKTVSGKVRFRGEMQSAIAIKDEILWEYGLKLRHDGGLAMGVDRKTT